MQLDFALLALNAEIGEGGKFHIFGGGFDTVQVTEVPATIPPFVLVARFVAPQQQAQDPHTFSLSIRNPVGEETVLGENRPLPIPPCPDDPEQTVTTTALARIQIQFLHVGRYEFELRLDGMVVKHLPVFVRKIEAAGE